MDGGTISEILNTGFVILIELGNPGIETFGSAMDKETPFSFNFGSAFISNKWELIVPATGKIVSPTPADAINVSTPPAPLISSSAIIVIPASIGFVSRPGSDLERSDKTLPMLSDIT